MLTRPIIRIIGGALLATTLAGCNSDAFVRGMADEMRRQSEAERYGSGTAQMLSKQREMEKRQKELEWKMEQQERDRRFSCIQSGGVPVGGGCL